ncbi:adenylate/guanylate cyclase [Naegleria gruberi]|uniref:Adenylate/guanylate cyclase n=1 Tax=Naegleria gruberi TaxID=5762 RepID=D2VIU3_NAEGR|nr:adenylate/guanylate cyclase [Naegleria gruberi]EFC43412.1 adenylate/guanylate cyclase [Naegleria gruberi]|eukprot:XP_002676156.1 adenylate/guanylate cyclase [Naegleria gruberi strain NEG-M]
MLLFSTTTINATSSDNNLAPTYKLETIAGGNLGDGYNGLDTPIGHPHAIAFYPRTIPTPLVNLVEDERPQDLIIIDRANNLIRKLTYNWTGVIVDPEQEVFDNIPTVVSTIAGVAASGSSSNENTDGLPANTVKLTNPNTVTVSLMTGDIYFVENNPTWSIKKIDINALLIQTQWLDSNNCVFSMSLLKRASSQHPNIFQQFKIREKMKQIESFNLKSKSTSNSFELTSQLDILEKNQNNLLVLHRNFWKEMASERINYSSVEKINRSIYALTTQCRNTLQNLIFNNKNNKTLLRLYGNFLENFEFNSELAQYYYNEASSIEEEEMKKKRRASVFSNATSNKRGTNRVMPLHETKANFEPYLFPVEEQPNEDDMESAFENPKMRKEQIFKNAISSQRSNSTTVIISLLYIFVCLCLVVSSIALSSYYSDAVISGVPFLQQVCQPSISPYSALRNVRATQNFVNTFMLFEYPWPISYQGNIISTKPNYFANSLKRLKEELEVYKTLIKLGQSNSFDETVYSDYSINNFTINYPNENSKDVTIYDLGSSSQKNVSILEFTNNMIKYTQNVINEFPWDLLQNISNNNNDAFTQSALLDLVASDKYFNPLKNYNFMFLFANRETASLAFDTFCARYLDRSIDSIELSTQNLVYYTGAVLVAFFLISIAYLSYMIFEMSHMTKIVKIYEKHLSKDVIGKIFHSLNNKTTDTANNADNTFSLAKMKSNISTIILISLITLFTCASIAMFYYESNANAFSSSKVMKNVRLSIQAATIIQRIGFNSGEVMTYFVASEISNKISPLAVNFKRNVTYGDPRLFNTVTNFNVLFDRVTTRLPTLSSMWSRLIYGDPNTGDDQILGRYSDVDSLVTQGVSSNCSDYLQKNNITLTMESYMMYCVGLETLLNDYLTLIPQLLTESRKQNTLQKAATPKGILLAPTDVALSHNQALRMSVALTNKFVTFMKVFVSSSSNPSFGVTIVFACLEFLACLVIFSLLYTIYMNYCGQLHSLRLMSQYIPVEVLERNETLRNFILYNNTNSLSTRMKKKDKSSSSSTSSISDLKNVFNSSVEGSIICNENHEIEFLNYSALKMFGMKPIDVLGTSISQLVESTQQDELNKCIKYIFKKSGKDSDKKDEDQDDEDVQLKQVKRESEEGNGKCEIVELDCIRRNQTKFPCKITLFTVKIQGERGSMRNILIVTMKDLTSEKKQNALLSEEKQKSDNLLKNILPTSVASRLKSGHTFIAEKLDDITCFFSDMVGFTAISSNMQATDLVMMLNSIVNGFDMLTEKYDLEKIKTIGDAYFAVGGLPGAATSDHPERVLKFAIETFGVINDFNSNRLKSVDNNEQEEVVKETDNELKVKSSSPPPQQINIRVGINTGSVVAGVIGMKKFAYDLWGDTINIASRMESTSKNGRIQISRSTYERVFDLGYDFEEREVDVKGKGIVKTYLLNDKHHRHLKNNPLLYSNNRSMPILFSN